MKKLWTLCWTFARIGAVTFGGGTAMLPILQREIVEEKKWASEEELMDYYAVSRCTPGVVAVNVSTFIGQKYAGIPGGICSTLGLAFPSIVIISVIAAFFTEFASYPWVAHALRGIQLCVCVQILNAGVGLLKKAVPDIPAAMIFGLTLLGSWFLPVSPVIFILLAAAAGLAVKSRKGKD